MARPLRGRGAGRRARYRRQPGQDQPHGGGGRRPAPALAERIELLARCGLADLEPVEVGGTAVVPRAVLLACLRRRGATAPPSNRTTAVHVVDAEGTRDGAPATVRAVAVTVPHERWGLGGGVVSTAAPAAEAARRLVRGEVDGVGVLAPERAFPAGPFLAALAATGCTVTIEDDPLPNRSPKGAEFAIEPPHIRPSAGVDGRQPGIR
jgi:hypothetical protein